MRKSLLLLVFFFGVTFVSACTNDDANNDGDVSQNNVIEDDNEFMYLDLVTEIELDDIVEDSYIESIYVTLDDEDIDALKKIVSKIEKSEEHPVSKSLYSLTFYDEKNDVIDVWEVSNVYTVKTGNNIILSRKNELDEWLDMIENKYNITFDIFNRTPGKNYMQQLEQADNAYITEITDNNFVSGVSCNLDEDDILSFKSLKDEIQIMQEKQNIDDYYYKIDFFDINGIELYSFIVDFDGKIYTSTGFEMTGEKVMNWFGSVEKKYKLNKIQ